MDTRKARFKFFVEVSVTYEQLTGKWSAKYRYGDDAETCWMGAGTQHNTVEEASDAVLAKVHALFPDLTGDWFSQARAQLTSGGVR